MKHLFFLLVILGFFLKATAQTGIGTTTPDASAKLDVSATNKGFLPPRVTLTGYMDITTIASPATGLLVYNTGSNANLAAGYYYWNGNSWATIATAGGSGSFAASYLRGSRTSSQTLNVNDNLIYNTIDNTAGSNISLNTSTGKITLTAGNTYRLIASVPNFYGSRPSFSWYNETAGATIGSAVNGYSPSDAAGNGSFGGIAEVIITPSVSTVVYLKLVSASNSSSTGTINIFPNGDFVGGVGYPWFEAQVIGGNAPVTGQSVDYVQASLSANQTLSAAGNIIFNVSSGAGITLSSGGFNLIANKTYRLEAALGGTSGGYAYYAWVDNANNLLPGGSIGAVMKAGSAFTDAPQDRAGVFYTPTTNTTVYLRVLSVSGGLTAYVPNAGSSYSSAWASIQQVGSSAIVNPWVLSGNNVVNTSGNVGIGTTAPLTKLHVQTANNTSVYVESTTTDNNGMVIFNANTNQSWANNWHEFLMFQNQGTTIGHISGGSNGSAMTYNTTSDYRLKTDLKNYSGLALVNKIKTYDFAWKKDSSRMYGVLAHELQAVIPYMVTGNKDAVDATGNILPQAVDYSKLTPILVKAIQEQEIEINKLKAEKELMEKSIQMIQRRLLTLENKKK